MAYNKQNFTDGSVLTADNLNHIEDGIVANENNITNLSNNFESVEIMAESAIRATRNIVNVVDIPGELKNLLNPKNLVNGYYVAKNGQAYNNSSYCYYELDVVGGATYNFSFQSNIKTDGSGQPGNGAIYAMSSRFIAMYNSSGQAIESEGLESKSVITIPDGIVKVTLSFYLSNLPNDNCWMIVKSADIPTIPIPYKESGNMELTDGFKELIQKEAVASEPSRFISNSGNLGIGEKLKLELNHIKFNKHFIFNATIQTMGTFRICNGYHEYGSAYVEIDSTSIQLKTYNSSETIVATWSHDLTISNNIQVYIDIDENSKATIRVCSMGNWYENTMNNFSGSNGEIYVESVNAIFTDCILSFTSEGYWKDIQMYGDSYFGTSLDRWVHYLISDGYSKNILIDGYSGRGCTSALLAFKKNITHSKPKYAVWCMGMNDNDSATAIAPSYKVATDEFLSICDNNGIIPILSTIPSAVGGQVDDTDISTMRINKWKNAYVRESGRRYIDFDKAVGASETDGTWYSSMLSSDGVHPTVAGAKTLYLRALVDFPELMK